MKTKTEEAFILSAIALFMLTQISPYGLLSYYIAFSSSVMAFLLVYPAMIKIKDEALRFYTDPKLFASSTFKFLK